MESVYCDWGGEIIIYLHESLYESTSPAHNNANYTISILTLRRLMSYIYIYIYGAPILDVSRSHTMTQHSR